MNHKAKNELLEITVSYIQTETTLFLQAFPNDFFTSCFQFWHSLSADESMIIFSNKKAINTQLLQFKLNQHRCDGKGMKYLNQLCTI